MKRGLLPLLIFPLSALCFQSVLNDIQKDLSSLHPLANDAQVNSVRSLSEMSPEDSLEYVGNLESHFRSASPVDKRDLFNNALDKVQTIASLSKVVSLMEKDFHTR